jgi:hypothetical protein
MLVRLTGLTRSLRQTVAVHPLHLEIASGDVEEVGMTVVADEWARPHHHWGQCRTFLVGVVEVPDA